MYCLKGTVEPMEVVCLFKGGVCVLLAEAFAESERSSHTNTQSSVLTMTIITLTNSHSFFYVYRPCFPVSLTLDLCRSLCNTDLIATFLLPWPPHMPGVVHEGLYTLTLMDN